jgi:hypothetical protein
MRIQSLFFLTTSALSLGLLPANSALAQGSGPQEIAGGVTLDPVIDLRLRLETSDQDNAVDAATAVTLRGRAGLELASNGFSVLVEGEGTVAFVDDYNDTIPGNGLESFSVVADPENVELNRAQIAYKNGGTSVTLGRQRLIHPGARWVGNVGWRQNEQTFDAVRAQTKIGPVKLDAAYAISQRTIFGEDSPNEEFEGDLILLRGDVDLKPVTVTPFFYSIDYDTRLAFSSQTIGAEVKGAFPIGGGKINVAASYATQSDLGDNPNDYSADYIAAELGGSIAGFGLKAGYEELGSDGGTFAFQTPLATLHKFNGWADLFLATPATGLRDYYIGASKGFKVKALPGLKAAITYHKFEADFGGADYGDEINAVISFKVGKVGILAKYAKYNADSFAVDTEKFWLQAGISF